MGTDTRNDYLGWNVSAQQDEKQRKIDLANDIARCAQLNKVKETILLATYSNPVQSQMAYNEKLREMKQSEKPIRDQIRNQFTFANPAASKEKADAAVFRINYENKIEKQKFKAVPTTFCQSIQDPHLTFNPDLSRTLKSNKQQRAYHTGVWQNFKFEQDEEGNEVEIGAWSCCQNEDPNNEGCNKYQVDKNKWNYTSYVS